MQTHLPTFPPDKIYTPELAAILDRATRGDPTVLPELKKAFDEHPELARMMGDLVEHAQQSVLTLVAGSCLTAREAIGREAMALRDRLAAAANSELEKLLVDRVVLCWLEVYHSDIDLAQHLMKSPGSGPDARAAHKRLDRAQARYLAAIRALATTQKLLKPALSPRDLAVKLVPETKVDSLAGQRQSADVARGAPVLN
jgi:hypothetical protein